MRLSDLVESEDIVAKVRQFNDELNAEYNIHVLHFYMVRSNGYMIIDSIMIAKEQLKTGLGTKIMQRLVAFADQNGLAMALTPGLKDDRWGTTSRNRLIKFYKRFGFVENKGRKKDFTTVHLMIRKPQT